MIERARALAVEHGAAVRAHVRAWEDLPPSGDFDTVLCVGNSLTHAADRRAALAAMAATLRPGGRLVLTSRNWERGSAAGTRLEIDESLTERHGRRALLTRAWTIGDGSIDLEVAVSFIEADGTVESISERLTTHPFTHAQLEADLRAAGLEPTHTTYTPTSDAPPPSPL